MRKLIGFAIICALVFSTTLPAEAARIRWNDYETGIAKAQDTGKNVFVFFSSKTCKYCELMKKKAFREKSVISYLNDNFISIKVSIDKQPSVARKFGVRPVPDSYFLSPSGEKLGRRLGYMGPKQFKEYMVKVNENQAEKK